MATAYARWILSTQSRSTLKMQRFEPSIHLAFAAVRCRKGSVPLWRLHYGTSGGLFGCVFCHLSYLFSLLSSLFSLLLVVVVLRRLDPMRRVTHSTHDKPCQFSCCCSELERLALSALFSVRSSLSALFPLLSLPLISQIALRTCPFDLCIRPSTSHPTASTLCGSLPGPAECAKRLNNNDNNNNDK